MSKTNNKKFRNWAFILYEDSAPPNWRQLIIKSGVPTACSPWHNLDINELGENLKPHKHCIVAFKGPTTQANVKFLMTDPLNATRPEPVASIRGYYNYFTHEHETDKAVYSALDVEVFNGFDIERFDVEDKIPPSTITAELCALIIDNNVTNFTDLFQIALNLGSEYIDILSKKAYFFRCFINDLRFNKEG